MTRSTKSKFFFYTLLSTTMLTLLSCFVSIAWFISSKEADSKSDGSTVAAYFAYGKGTKDKPYGINTPRHLYNLAWLQYMDQFDKDGDDDDTKLDTYYFEIDSSLDGSLDMKNMVIPPIGDQNHPFIGYFNGNGKVIENLMVSNDFSSFKKHPYSITSANYTPSNIVGLFGVVGEYRGSLNGNYDTQANEIVNVGIKNLTVQSKTDKTLIGLAAGYVNGTLSGVAVNDSEIDLSGAGGQCVDSAMTENLSDYSLIGYAADKKYLNTLKNSETEYDVPQVSNPFLTQGGDQWGGSIDMKTMYNNLKSKVNDTTNRKKTVLTDQDIDYAEEERTLPTQTYSPIASSSHKRSDSASPSNKYKGYYHYYYKDFDTKLDNSTQVQTASYSFSDGLSSGYIGLSGRYSFDSYTKYTKQITHEGTKNTITIKSGSHYLKANGNSSNGFNASANSYTTDQDGILSDTTTSNEATNWLWDDTSKTLSTSINSFVYYLYNNNGTLVLSTTQKSSAWTWDTSAKAFKNGSYYLIFDGIQWTLSSSTSVSFYSIGSGSNYLSYSLSSGQPTITNTTDYTQSRWYFDSDNYVYTIIDGTKYYLYYYLGSNTDQYISLTTSTNADYLFKKNNSNYIFFTYSYMWSSTNYYLTYSSDNWTLANSQTSLTITRLSTSYQNTISSWDTSTYASETKTITTYPTYFPLTWEENRTTKPSDKNTGYILGGEYFDGSGNDGNTLGDVRLAGDNNKAYTTSKMTGARVNSNSPYSKSNFFAYTFDSTGALKKIKDPINNVSGTDFVSYSDLGLTKYYLSLLNTTSGSRPALDNMLSGGTAYGLHFMNADISMEHKITVPYALINGVEYENYELPEDSIDFNLKSTGRINFFAHTMYVNGNITWNNSNNSFFSLHRIIRSGSTITGIKQIAKIYKNSQYTESNGQPEYVYTYRDSSDSEDTSDYDTGVYGENGNIIKGAFNTTDMVFDTYWLTDPEYSKFVIRACYYFEIPVNQGEYALGSVSGKTKTSRGWTGNGAPFNKNGAYLMYLDIGASKKSNTALVIDEKSTTTTKTYSYPKGVDFKDLSELKTIDAYKAVQGGESSAIVLTTVNTLSVEYTYKPKIGNIDALLTVGPSNGNGTFKAKYKRNDIDVKNGAGTIIETADPDSTSTDVMERESTYDLTSSNTNKTMSIYEVHTVDGIQQTPITSTKTVSWSDTNVKNIVNIEIEGVLFTVTYDSPAGSDVTLVTTYDILNRKYTLNFVSENGGENISIRFTGFNLTPDSTNTSLDFSVYVENNGVSSGTAIGDVKDMLNTNIAIVVNKKS